jgi:DNA protecting protein DprA
MANVAQPQDKQLGLFEGGRKNPPQMSFDVSLLALSQVKGLGRKGIIALCDAFGGKLEDVWSTEPQKVAEILSTAKIPSAESISSEIFNHEDLQTCGEQALLELKEQGVTVLSPREVPLRLQKIPTAPRWLFVQGNAELLAKPAQIAVVGTRNPTDEGKEFTEFIVKMMAAYPVILVSGLAEGIDDVAHRASLRKGIPNIAFLGHGITTVFPKETKETRQQIIDNSGAIVTEYLPKDNYSRGNFVERNRLQAGLADLVIPVEAQLKSGTAHTVRFAHEYKRQLIGIRWKGASGILEELLRIEASIIDIKNPLGWKKLDLLLQDVVRGNGLDAFPLQRIEKELRGEVRARTTVPSDFDRLIEIINQLKESS